MTIHAILTDIEGTTSSIRFVHDVLFPYAKDAMPEFLRANEDNEDIQAIIRDACAEADEPDATIERVIEIFANWISEDRKITALKSLQGHIWRNGYEQGNFTGHMYTDAVEYLRRWHGDGVDLFVYSSGSVAAQKLLFGHSDAGDLTPLFSGYFDTRIGHKRETQAYRTIMADIGRPGDEILFLSDVAEELDAAAAAGLRTTQLIREDDIAAGTHPVARSFAEVDL